MKLLRIALAAREDLIAVWQYIAEDNPARADSFIDEFYAKFQTLAENPSIGRRRDELREGIRSLPNGRYVVFYVVDEECVEIVRVLSGYRDLDSLFE